MRERRWYSRFGIEPPFPWPALILMPIGWLVTAAEKLTQALGWEVTDG